MSGRLQMIILALLLSAGIASPPLTARQAEPDSVGLALVEEKTAADNATGEEKLPPPLRIVKNDAFREGEKLSYVIRYGPILAGYSSLSIPEVVEVNGHPAYHIISEAWSNKFFSRFYKVQDRVESFTDVRGIFSWKFEKHLREGSYRADQYVVYDQQNRLAYTEKDTMEIPLYVQDVLSAMYYVRTLTFEPGDTLYVDNHADGKVYPLAVIIHKRERIKVKAGKFDCIVVEPVLKTSGVFKQKGRLVVHFTDDERKIPVLMTSQIYVKAFSLGSVVAELEKIEGVPGY